MQTFKQEVRNTFVIQGKLTFKEKPELKTFLSKNGKAWKGKSFQIGVNVNGGLHFIKFFGGATYKKNDMKELADVKFKNASGDEVILSAVDAQDENKMEAAPNYLKKHFNNKVFLYDELWIDEVYANLDNLKDKLVNVYGNVEFQYNADKSTTYTTFSPTRISIVEDNDKQFAKGSFQLVTMADATNGFYEDGQINKALLENFGGKIPVTAYVPQYNSDKNTNDSVPYLYFPIDFVVNTSKLDLNVPAQENMLKFILSQCSPQGGDITTVGFEVQFIKGATNVELTEEQKKAMLTPEESMYISMFPEEAEKFLKHKLGKTTERVNDIALIKPHPNFPIKQKVDDLTLDILELHKTIGAYSANGKGKTETPKPQPQAVAPQAEAMDYESFFSM